MMQSMNPLIPISLTSIVLGLGCILHVVQGGGDADGIVLAAIKPPERPENFRNLLELNKYLDELKQYYTIIGRPRFGKRNSWKLDADEYDGSVNAPNQNTKNFARDKSNIKNPNFSNLLIRMLDPEVVLWSPNDDAYES